MTLTRIIVVKTARCLIMYSDVIKRSSKANCCISIILWLCGNVVLSACFYKIIKCYHNTQEVTMSLGNFFILYFLWFFCYIGVLVTRSLVLCVCFVYFLLVIALSVPLRFTYSDSPFGIFKLFLIDTILSKYCKITTPIPTKREISDTYICYYTIYRRNRMAIEEHRLWIYQKAQL
jgi:hypothetical protein